MSRSAVIYRRSELRDLYWAECTECSETICVATTPDGPARLDTVADGGAPGVPASSGHAEYSRLFGKGAIYCINLCDENTARAAAAYTRPPLKAYEPLPQLAGPDGVAVTRAQVDDEYDFGDDEPPL